MRKALMLTALGLLAACADPIEDAREAVKAKAANPRGIEYRNVESHGNNVVCGEFMEEDRWGEGPGYQPFIVYKGEASLKPSGVEQKILCSADPAAALQSELGIGPVNKENKTLVKVHADLSTLTAALDAYKNDFKKYPSVVTGGGLTALTKPRRGSPDPKDTYLTEIPVDPWGQDYIYRTPRLLHGKKDRYELYTLGKDEKEGGSGEDADVRAEYLRYIDHVGGL